MIIRVLCLGSDVFCTCILLDVMRYTCGMLICFARCYEIYMWNVLEIKASRSMVCSLLIPKNKKFFVLCSPSVMYGLREI